MASYGSRQPIPIVGYRPSEFKFCFGKGGPNCVGFPGLEKNTQVGFHVGGKKGGYLFMWYLWVGVGGHPAISVLVGYGENQNSQVMYCNCCQSNNILLSGSFSGTEQKSSPTWVWETQKGLTLVVNIVLPTRL
jgi:hypothetical protein